MREIKEENVSLIFKDCVLIGMFRRDGEHVKNYTVKVANLQDIKNLIVDNTNRITERDDI